jgi:hypothetical protein
VKNVYSVSTLGLAVLTAQPRIRPEILRLARCRPPWLALMISPAACGPSGRPHLQLVEPVRPARGAHSASRGDHQQAVAPDRHCRAPSSRPPDDLAHCEHPRASALGGRCFGAHRRLFAWADAKCGEVEPHRALVSHPHAGASTFFERTRASATAATVGAGRLTHTSELK